jgi:hypothetical protein
MRVFLWLKELYTQVWWALDSAATEESRIELTCEDGRFQQLDKLINLDKCVHRHFQVSAATVSGGLRQT